MARFFLLFTGLNVQKLRSFHLVKSTDKTIQTWTNFMLSNTYFLYAAMKSRHLPYSNCPLKLATSVSPFLQANFSL